MTGKGTINYSKRFHSLNAGTACELTGWVPDAGKCSLGTEAPDPEGIGRAPGQKEGHLQGSARAW